MLLFSNRSFTSLLCSGAIALGLVACPQQSPPPELRVGLIAGFTGETAAAIGPSSTQAAELAVQEANRNGGLQVGKRKYAITLILADDRNNPEEAVKVAQKLINQDNAIAIVGPYISREAIPVAQVVENAQIPMISPTSTNPKTTENKQYVFRVVFTDEFQGRVMANFAREELKVSKAAVLYDRASDYNRSIAEIFQQVFQQTGGEVVAFETYTTDTNQDFRPQLQRIRDSGAEILFLPNYEQELYLQVQQARELGIQIPLLGSDTWEALNPAENPQLEGSFFSTNYAPDPTNPKNQAFIKAYRELYQNEPDNVAALTYDAFGLLFEAIESQGETDPAKIREGLSQIQQFTGVSGTAEFAGTGDPIKSAAIMQIKTGQVSFYKSVAP
ncbi:ABC transporter substrate-binding protein [Desertifilum sp. FACHB-1129]|uniref:Leucine-binding protein domain-containing protein n=1 Tax=Desertifilum tharense IPPAS B-1220 TaxID=1781255 RepID=A0A1E5QCH6_9CYAN|nr:MULTISPECIES: ABC transporter substrate-binding protein [Desertifilum]MDA0210850.1 ABC transporter substrate-binding protein [Cyanobacteria bacterium FC1]MBD2312083.1 ABC transporter substrate-binding protein [Desertifilum sp. FACHB-1129]MBD2322256.1 ABC transporter substrate-binding protein [Desertifilum sp. FACHB-866]MBD2332293.1 ABC transporter substrate-binding protein [Desertifilum sp. FACHB-868]OEJ72349.1 hypothetical protein BH720_25045 [Desertifilum tharense IPPAS B-1220]